MGINRNPFPWWPGASWATIFWGLRGRWCIYAGANDTSRISPAWFSWMHHQIDDVPDRSLPAVRQWQKPAVPNMTGTALAYRPSGALEKGGQRPPATGDYEAWTPEG